MHNDKHTDDARVRRTRSRLMAAFQKLATEQRYDSISTRELTSAGGVGRATFYEHYSDKDALMIEALDPLLLPLANAASGRAPKAAVRIMLSHIWNRRALFRSLLESGAHKKIVRRLAEMIEARLALEGTPLLPDRVSAIAAAHGQIAVLRIWVSGEVSVPVDTLARQLMAFRHLRLDQG